LNYLREEPPYLPKNHGSPGNAADAGLGGNVKAMYRDGVGNYTLPFSGPAQDNGSKPRTITADNLISHFTNLDGNRGLADSANDKFGKTSSTPPDSEGMASSYGNQNMSGRYHHWETWNTADPRFKTGFDKEGE
jgi:hypothetical protein